MTEINNNEIIEKEKITDDLSFEAEQNAVGLFSVLLEEAKKNPELWKEICNENNKDANDTNKTDEGLTKGNI